MKFGLKMGSHQELAGQSENLCHHESKSLSRPRHSYRITMQLHQITLALACGIAVSFVPASLRQPRAVARFGAYESAVAEAESAASKFGKQSPEAKTAWAAVEEIESADNSAATKPGLDEECDAANPYGGGASLRFGRRSRSRRSNRAAACRRKRRADRERAPSAAAPPPR